MKKQIIIVLVVITILFTSSSLFATQDSREILANHSEISTIKTTISRYFDARYYMQANLTPEVDLNIFFALDNSTAKEFLEKEKKYLELDIKHRKMQASDLRFKNYSYNLDYQKIDINDKTATVELLESSDIYFNVTPHIKSQMAGLKHTISLEKTNDEWKIISDVYYDNLKITVDEYLKSAESLDEAIATILKNSEEEVNEIKGKNVEFINPDETDIYESAIASNYTRYYLSRVNGVNYAKQWALGMNVPPWFNYETMGGDCTNFISQCLYAAGVPFDSSGSYKWYWYSDSNRAPSWTSASNFRTYAINNNSPSSSNYGLHARSSSWSNAFLCDIVQKTGHSMIISDVVCDSSGNWKIDYLICQHSVSSAGRLKDYPLSSISGTKSYISMYWYYK